VNLAFDRRTYRQWPTCGRILCEPEVRPIFVVVVNILGNTRTVAEPRQVYALRHVVLDSTIPSAQSMSY